jgi:glutamate--cysteine ligase
LDAQQIRFMDLFLLYCLLEESPACDEQEQAFQDANLEAVVNRGREPGLLLNNGGEKETLEAWANSLLSSMDGIAGLMDTAFASTDYSKALEEQVARVADPELTASARILREMREQDLPFFRLAMKYSEQWAAHFRSRTLPPEVQTRYEQESLRSTAAQTEIENTDQQSFSEYLSDFYAQYQSL